MAARTVLVVQRSRRRRDGLASELGRRGFRVIAARDGAEALSLAEGQRPRVLVSELLMPRMNGLELTRKLRLRSPSLRPVLTSEFRLTERQLALSGCMGARLLPRAASLEVVADAVEAASDRDEAPSPCPSPI